MYNNLLKSGNIVKNNETRVIDSNDKIAERLRYIAETLELGDEESYPDGFVAGLDADAVEQLLEDSDDEDNAANIVKTDTAAIEKMREEAQTAADSIIADANSQAEQIIAGANEEAEGIRESAAKKGHDEGYNAGYEEGVRSLDEKKAELEQKEADLESYYRQKIDELEPQFVDKLTDIYEHVFMVDLKDKKELIFYLLTDAMRNIEGGKNFFIHVSKDDYEYVTENKAQLMQGLPGSASLEVIEDISLTQSQCFIEAESGIFDCGLGTELSLLKKELRLLSYKQDSKQT